MTLSGNIHIFSNTRRLCSCVSKKEFSPSWLRNKFHDRGYGKRYFRSKCCLNRRPLNVTARREKLFSKIDASNLLLTNGISSRLFQTSAVTLLKDYYNILGVKKGDSAADMKKAYYQLAKKYHPDVNKEPGAAKRFREMQEAYMILSDEKKRAAYDQNGQTDFHGSGGGRSGNPFGNDPFGSSNPFGDDQFRNNFHGIHERTGTYSAGVVGAFVILISLAFAFFRLIIFDYAHRNRMKEKNWGKL